MEVNERHGDWMVTYTGLRFYPLDSRPEDVCIEDIAHHLSCICRFNGACKSFYSVAQHSVHVAEVLPLEHRLWGLLHDAAEAYVGDMIRPIKRQPEMVAFSDAEDEVMLAVRAYFGLQTDMPEEVKLVDDILLATEARDLTNETQIAYWQPMPTPLPNRIIPWPPLEAESRFLRMYERIRRDMKVEHMERLEHIANSTVPDRRQVVHALAGPIAEDAYTKMRRAGSLPPTDSWECSADHPCCAKRNNWNGFGGDTPLLFVCPVSCPCHD